MKVLIAIDSAPSSQRVLVAILSRPWPSGTAFCILHVVDLQTFARLPVLIEEASREGADLLQDAAAKLSGGGYQACTKLLLGYPRGELSAYAKEWGADLIILGSHGRRGLDRFLIGSVSEAVAVHASCSVQVIRADQHIGD
jgi:nucleotide-binding universal stress UspA family protein